MKEESDGNSVSVKTEMESGEDECWPCEEEEQVVKMDTRSQISSHDPLDPSFPSLFSTDMDEKPLSIKKENSDESSNDDRYYNQCEERTRISIPPSLHSDRKRIPQKHPRSKSSSSSSTPVNKPKCSRKTFSCSFCSQAYSSLNELQSHRKKAHPIPIPCIFCPQTFPSTSEEKTHLKIHAGDRPYECKLCPSIQTSNVNNSKRKMVTRIFKTFFTLGAWFAHVDAHKIAKKSSEQASRPNSRVCCQFPGCLKDFASNFALCQHQKIHNRPASFPCLFPQCGRVFKLQSSLSFHVKRKHERNEEKASSIPGLQCPVPNCPGKFGDQEKYEQLVQVHFSTTFGCPNCPKRFKQEYALARHVVFHTDSLPFRCSVILATVLDEPKKCKGFGTKTELTAHIQSEHNEKPKNYECGECKAVFKQGSELRKHLRSHGEVVTKPVAYGSICPVAGCNLRILNKKYMHQHVKSHVNVKMPE